MSTNHLLFAPKDESAMNTITPPNPAGSEALTELGRFLTLVGGAAVRGADTWLPMFSPAVDGAWHLLQDTPERHDSFCREHAGRPVRHLPARGHGAIAWVAAYEAAYGPLPQVWFTDADGTVNERLWSAYQRTGTVVTDWDCGPEPGDVDPEEGIEAPPAPAHTNPPNPQQKPLPGYGE